MFIEYALRQKYCCVNGGEWILYAHNNMTFVVFEIKVLKEIVYRIRFNRNIVVSGDVWK